MAQKGRENPQRKFSPDQCNLTESLTAESEQPQSMHDALNDKDANKWKQEFEEKYNSFIKNETWELVPPPDAT